MSVEEKLQTMEALWLSLSADLASIESPAWHEWFESLAVAQFTCRGGHPLQPD